jgi:hypothetical protein
VATELTREAERLAREQGIVRFRGMGEGLRDQFPVSEDGLRPVKVFAHYLGDDRGAMRERFARVHDDVLYELRFS